MGIVEHYLVQLNIEKRRWRRTTAILTVLSLLVAAGVSWNLRMTAVTLANDACCGYEEHQHTEACLEKTALICGCDENSPETSSEPSDAEAETGTYPDEETAADETLAQNLETNPGETIAPHTHTDACYQWENQCGYEEHIHKVSCYSDPKADVENQLDWQNMFADYPYTGKLGKDLVGVAKTQAGYRESTLNFEADDDGTRHGYTRYGAWYGAPYGDWSAMFVSFCLNYAGADLTKYPTSSGANTMAGLWDRQGKYAPAGQYVPVSGDLVFFRNNSVGIVVEVQNATIYALAGDVGDAVGGKLLSLNDSSIAGWGIIEGLLPDTSSTEEIPTEETPTEEAPTEAAPTEEAPTEEVPTEATPTEEASTEEAPTEEVPTEEAPTEETPAGDVQTAADLFDISNGPAVFIFEGRAVQLKRQQFSLRNPRTVTDLRTYLEANGGSYFFTMLDYNNVELPKDSQGNYIAQANTDYKLSLSFNSPKGFSPGTYQYQIPNGLMVNGGAGDFILKDGTNVGSWVVTDTGLITLVFNENMNSRTDITVSVALGIRFAEQEEPINFDGKITVTVEPPPPQQFPTKLNKWGQQGSSAENSGQDPTKLYWTLEITGDKDSQIPGNILSDQVLQGEWSKDHRYTASDIAGGLEFGVSEPDPVTGEFKDWHSWHVYADDPHLIWTETGWSYKVPQTVTCQWCGEVELGNENWIYSVKYTSTPDRMGTAGTYGYENQASIDGQHAYAWTDFTHGETHGVITKNGTLVSDAAGGNYVWEFQATIPGRGQGQKAEYHWYIMDYMYLLNQEAYHAGYMENDAHLALVTANYNGTTVQVPKIQDATADDPFAWENAWTANNNGVNYGREINLLCRCHCNENNCQFWNGKCENYWFDRGDGTWVTNGFCQCWTPEEEITFTFAYTTDALPVIEKYGGLGYQLQNVAELHYKPNGSSSGALVDSAQAAAPIPGLFKKELTQDFDGYTAHYCITVNEAKVELTNGSPVTIHDVMSDTLAYISGSLVVTSEDADGNRFVLRQGVHYTVTYDGSDGQRDEAGNKVHTLDIVIIQPQPVMYILDYDTTLLMPEQLTEGVKYSNSATVTLWGGEIADTGVEKVYADINIAAKSYAVEMVKTCAVSGKPLAGAVFGLHNEQGGLIATGETDDNGGLAFQTSIIEGIILREHELYYLQEIQPPMAYQLDDTKHWFCFCNNTRDSCEKCVEIASEVDAIRIPLEQVRIIDIENDPVNIELPSTGGIGGHVYLLCGSMLVSAPFAYGFKLKRNYKKRSRK